MSRLKVKLICPICGKERMVFKSAAKRRKSNLCIKCAIEKRADRLHVSNVKPRKIVKCGWCGKEKLVLPKIAASKKNHYCNSRCYGKRISTKKLVYCSTCGKSKFASPRDLERNKSFFCNQECRKEFNHPQRVKRIKVQCSFCERIFDRMPWLYRQQIKRSKTDKVFCDIKCAGKYKTQEGTISKKCSVCEGKIIRAKSRFRTEGVQVCGFPCFRKHMTSMAKFYPDITTKQRAHGLGLNKELIEELGLMPFLEAHIANIEFKKKIKEVQNYGKNR